MDTSPGKAPPFKVRTETEVHQQTYAAVLRINLKERLKSTGRRIDRGVQADVQRPIQRKNAHLSRNGLFKMCIFDQEMFTEDHVSRQVVTVLSSQTFDTSFRIRRVTPHARQSNGSPPYYVLTFTFDSDGDEADAVMGMLHAVAPHASWRVERWLPYLERKRNRSDPNQGLPNTETKTPKEDTNDDPADDKDSWQEVTRKKNRRADRTTGDCTATPTSTALTHLQLNAQGAAHAKIKGSEFGKLLSDVSPEIIALQELYGGATKSATVNKKIVRPNHVIPGFTAFYSPFVQQSKASHGVMLAVKRSLNPVEFCPATVTTVHVVVWLNKVPVLVISAYYPHNRAEKKATRLTVTNVVKEFRRKYPEGEIIVSGDFNADPAAVVKWIQKDKLGNMQRIKMEGEGTSPAKQDFYTRRQVVKGIERTSCIDHVLASTGLLANNNRVSALTNLTLSDHLPLVSYYEVEIALVQPSPPRKKVDLKALSKKKDDVVSDKWWGELVKLLHQGFFSEECAKDPFQPVTPQPEDSGSSDSDASSNAGSSRLETPQQTGSERLESVWSSSTSQAIKGDDPAFSQKSAMSATSPDDRSTPAARRAAGKTGAKETFDQTNTTTMRGLEHAPQKAASRNRRIADDGEAAINLEEEGDFGEDPHIFAVGDVIKITNVSKSNRDYGKVGTITKMRGKLQAEAAITTNNSGSRLKNVTLYGLELITAAEPVGGDIPPTLDAGLAVGGQVLYVGNSDNPHVKDQARLGSIARIEAARGGQGGERKLNILVLTGPINLVGKLIRNVDASSVKPVQESEIQSGLNNEWGAPKQYKGQIEDIPIIDMNTEPPYQNLVNDLGEKLLDSMGEVFDKHGVLKDPQNRRRHSSKTLIRLLAVKNEARALLAHAVAVGDRAEIEEREVGLKAAAKAVLARERSERNAGLYKLNKKCCYMFDINDPGQGWKIIKNHLKASKATISEYTPVMDAAGTLQVTADGISKAWGEAQNEKSEDIDGTSRHADKWIPIFETRAKNGKICDPLPEDKMNAAFSFEEFIKIVRSFKNGKAPGMHGFPMEAVKACLPTKEEMEESREKKEEIAPQNAMATAVYGVVKLMWDFGVVPDKLNESEVFQIYKGKGLPEQDVWSYRGITLLEVLMKVYTSLCDQRTSKLIDEADRWNDHQGGFRNDQETMQCPVALVDLCLRRKLCKLNTLVNLYDEEKAFDKVKQILMLYELYAKGVRGSALSAAIAIYRNAKVCTRLGNNRTELQRMLLGGGQGSSSMPGFFSNLMDDIFEECPPHFGISFPHLANALGENGFRHVCHGLTFADDTVTVTGLWEHEQPKVCFMDEWNRGKDLSYHPGKCERLHVRTDTPKAKSSDGAKKKASAGVKMTKLDLKNFTGYVSDSSDTSEPSGGGRTSAPIQNSQANRNSQNNNKSGSSSQRKRTRHSIPQSSSESDDLSSEEDFDGDGVEEVRKDNKPERLADQPWIGESDSADSLDNISFSSGSEGERPQESNPIEKPGFSADPDHAQRETLGKTTGPNKPVILSNIEIPIVSEARYLGVILNDKLDFKKMIVGRSEVGMKALQAMVRYLASKHVPIGTRIMALRSCLVPVLVFSSEIWGGRSLALGHLQKLDDVLQRAAYALVRGNSDITKKRPPGHASTEVLLQELGLERLAGRCIQNATRLAIKGPHSKLTMMKLAAATTAPFRHNSTWYGSLKLSITAIHKWYGLDVLKTTWTDHTEQPKHPAWLSTEAGRSASARGPFEISFLEALLGSKVLMTQETNIYSPGDSAFLQTELSDLARRESKIVGRAVLEYQKRKRQPTQGTNDYGNDRYSDSAKVFRQLSMALPELAGSLHWILRMRCNAVILWQYAVKICGVEVYIPGSGKLCPKSGCGCCRTTVTDSLAHFLFRCNPTIDGGFQWRQLRSKQPLSAARRSVSLRANALTLARAVIDYDAATGLKKCRLTSNPLAVFDGDDNELVRLLLGGKGLTVSLAGTSRMLPLGLTDLKSWYPAEWNRERGCEKRRRDDYTQVLKFAAALPEDTDLIEKPSRTKLQKEYRFFEAALRLLAEFLDCAIPVRNAQFWATLSPIPASQRQPNAARQVP